MVGVLHSASNMDELEILRAPIWGWTMFAWKARAAHDASAWVTRRIAVPVNSRGVDLVPWSLARSPKRRLRVVAST